jgi:broad specificity phosphatase PhoE
VSIIYETHSLSTDNELGIATGWKDGQLSAQGRKDAKELGERRVHDRIEAVFCSDLGRAVETVKIAFVDSKIPIYFDSRLRECDYGDWNGAPVTTIHSTRTKYILQPYPNGQSYSDVVRAMAGFLTDLISNWAGHRVLIVGHAATRWALDHLINHVSLESLVNDPFNWQKGWQYSLPPNWSPPRAHAKWRRGPFCFNAFDLLWLDGSDLRGLTLSERKALLRKLLPPKAHAVLYVEHVANGTGCSGLFASRT